MANAVTVRRLTAGDADLAEVASHLNGKDWYEGSKPFTAATLLTFLQSPTNLYVVACIGGKVVGGLHGYCLLHPDGRKIVYIDEVDTIAGQRRKGVATAMMHEAFAWSKEQDAAEAWLGTEHDNEPAKELYEGLHPSEVDEGPIYTFKVNNHG